MVGFRARRLVAGLAVLIGIPFSLVMPPAPAHAAAAVCGTLAAWYEGMGQTATTSDWGVRATLVARTQGLCGSDPRADFNFNSEWVMLRENNARAAYMQSGYFRRFGTQSQYYTEYDRDGTGPEGYVRRLVGATDEGMGETYSVLFDGTCGCSRLGVGFAVLDSTPFNILSEWSDTKSEYTSAATYRESDVPGSAPAQSAIQGLRVQRPFQATFQANTAPLLDHEGSTRWQHGGLVFNSFLVWTDPL